MYIFSLCQMSQLLWQSRIVSPISGLKSVICDGFHFLEEDFLLFMFQVSLPRGRGKLLWR